MRYSPDMQIDDHVGPKISPKSTHSVPTMLLFDRQNCIPLKKVLLEDDVIVLLTPVVVPYSKHAENDRDPFEPLGRAIASRHPSVRHVPYTKRGGINNIHFEFIKRAKAIVFVISGPPADGDVSQVELADTARKMAEERPHIVVACCNIQTDDLSVDDFATIVQITGYAPSELETAASIIFGDQRPPIPNAMPVQNLIITPQAWTVDHCHDMTPIHQLWTECLPPKYHLPQWVLVQILRRDGFAMNYIVREPETRQVIGFCVTYTTYANREGENLLGSLGILLVKSAYRGRGVGLSLHNHALAQLRKVRGVNRIQLGSAFPRLLRGVPADSSAKEWFARRGWEMNGSQRGRGLDVSDWLLRFDDMPAISFSSAGLTFRQCGIMEFHQVLDIVDRDSARKDNMGWYDEYLKLEGTMGVEDVILGLEGETIIATALTYAPNYGSGVYEDIPWPDAIGADVGGVTCICITDDRPEMVNNRDSVMIRLLDACAKFLASRGMRQMFIDGVHGGDAGFRSLGFQEWARYKDVWQKA
ncbi:acetyltransferase [Colletotrichum plurivorum]|uniref:Acetyltransferase n=1 Tax=Colletotrichum plurivorum TaxID=2175906 RepID=A0A8H6KM39_9PEZI|nr:acetyltransferase [Colletotrichum plurivorum]